MNSRSGCRSRLCTPSDWILQSVKRGKRLPEFEFLVYKDARAAATLQTAFAPSSAPS
jgi:hypothetical protein